MDKKNQFAGTPEKQAEDYCDNMRNKSVANPYEIYDPFSVQQAAGYATGTHSSPGSSNYTDRLGNITLGV